MTFERHFIIVCYLFIYFYFPPTFQHRYDQTKNFVLLFFSASYFISQRKTILYKIKISLATKRIKMNLKINNKNLSIPISLYLGDIPCIVCTFVTIYRVQQKKMLLHPFGVSVFLFYPSYQHFQFSVSISFGFEASSCLIPFASNILHLPFPSIFTHNHLFFSHSSIDYEARTCQFIGTTQNTDDTV